MTGARYRVGIDVGGTFTDLVLADPASGRLVNHKEPSTPGDPSAAVEKGLRTLIEVAQVTAEQVAMVVHGTTIALNAVIQRHGDLIALVVSRGNRDVLEIARCRMASPYDIFARKEDPLVPRDRVFECSARARADGSVMAFPTDGELDELAERLRGSGAAAIAVNLLNAYAEPQVERDLKAALAPRLPGLPISLSSDLWPEIREYERTLVVTMNAYVHSLMDDYLATLGERLRGLGIGGGIYFTASNGGCMGLATALARPIDTILSGPASGVAAAAHLARAVKRPDIITVDMGGTSCDMAVCEGGEPRTTTQTRIGDFALVMPVVDISTIGAGGGSIVHVDGEGLLKVGPESAGAEPGPVCYGRGGTRPTVTDCYLALGYFLPEHFLGGRMTLDREAALAALEPIAGRLGMEGPERAVAVAEAVLSVASAKMATELNKGMARRGADPRGFTLVAYGGAGPTQANLLAEEARLDIILIPPAPGLFCALGALVSDLKRDFVRSLRARLDTPDVAGRVGDLFAALEGEALAWLEGEGGIIIDRGLARAADMRYVGQAYELEVTVPTETAVMRDVDAIGRLFHDTHRRVHGFADPEAPVEFHNLRVTARGRVPEPVLPAAPLGAPPEQRERRRVWHRGAWHQVPVHARAELPAAAEIAGPALIEQADTTVVLLAGWRGRVDGMGNLLVEREQGQ
jgi:N-methylhydantoinase A